MQRFLGLGNDSRRGGVMRGWDPGRARSWMKGEEMGGTRTNLSWLVIVLVLVGPAQASAVTEVNLGLADASFLGEAAGDQAGTAVAEVGDVNGDGYPDFLIGAPYNDDGGLDAGKAYLMLSGPYGWTRDFPLADADASFTGEAAGDAAGIAFAGSGDLDGDGFDDLLISAPYNDASYDDAGKIYVVFGAVSGWSQNTDLASSQTQILGESEGDNAGSCLDVASDVTGNGYCDLLIGARSNSENGDLSGKVYLLFGEAGASWPASVDLGTGEASFVGETAHVSAGGSCAGIGDINGDGFGDIAIGASSYATGAGKVYVVHGRSTGWTESQSLSTSDSSFIGEAAYDNAGRWVAGPGDLDSDGYSELLVGAPVNAEPGSMGAGQLYIERGTAAGWTQNQNLANSDASLYPPPSSGRQGWSAEGVGDYNGDGKDDIAVGAPNHLYGGTGNGTVNIFLGGAIVWRMDGPAANGLVQFNGEVLADGAGYSVSGAGDVDGDGADEILIGAPYSDQSGVDAGKAYLVFGELCSGADNDADGWTDCDGDCDDTDPFLHGGDADGDGFTPCGGDCDDGTPDAYPEAAEMCDGIADNNCDGQESVWDVDHDGDGWTSCAGDCNDADATLHPEDLDGDGYSPCDGDCDDSAIDVSPDSEEVCDGRDTDCDGEIPEEEEDADGDGVSICDGDCDDSNATVQPGADEVCDGVDNNCDGVADDVDIDGDGFTAVPCGGEDCDDSSAATHPDATESCQDEIDNDCDELVDLADPDCSGDDDDDNTSGDDDTDEAPSDDDTQEAGDAPDGQEGCGCDKARSLTTESSFSVAMLFALLVHLINRRMSRVGSRDPTEGS